MNLIAVWTLCQRELVRFYRDRSRLVGALVPPIFFWFLIGTGLGPAVRQFFFSGTLVLIVLFTSIFATISIIEDRREGFLQSVLVAPISRLSVVVGKILGASIVGFLQGLTFLVFASKAGLPTDAAGYALAAFVLLLASFALTGLGFFIAWKLDSTQGFHGIMNLFLIPLWMLSGSIFPADKAPFWLRMIIKVNPVTYAVSALQIALDPARAAQAHLASVPVCLIVLVLFGCFTIGISAWAAES